MFSKTYCTKFFKEKVGYYLNCIGILTGVILLLTVIWDGLGPAVDDIFGVKIMGYEISNWYGKIKFPYFNLIIFL